MWRQHKRPKRRYVATKFHSVTSQKPAAVRFFISLFTIFDQLISLRQCLSFTVLSDVFDCTVLWGLNLIYNIGIVQ
jgi:hypothetical protein